MSRASDGLQIRLIMRFYLWRCVRIVQPSGNRSRRLCAPAFHGIRSSSLAAREVVVAVIVVDGVVSIPAPALSIDTADVLDLAVDHEAPSSRLWTPLPSWHNRQPSWPSQHRLRRPSPACAHAASASGAAPANTAPADRRCRRSPKPALPPCRTCGLRHARVLVAGVHRRACLPVGASLKGGEVHRRHRMADRWTRLRRVASDAVIAAVGRRQPQPSGCSLRSVGAAGSIGSAGTIGSGVPDMSVAVGVESPPLWTQPYMTAVRATIEHAASKLRVTFRLLHGF